MVAALELEAHGALDADLGCEPLRGLMAQTHTRAADIRRVEVDLHQE